MYAVTWSTATTPHKFEAALGRPLRRRQQQHQARPNAAYTGTGARRRQMPASVLQDQHVMLSKGVLVEMTATMLTTTRNNSRTPQLGKIIQVENKNEIASDPSVFTTLPSRCNFIY